MNTVRENLKIKPNVIEVIYMILGMSLLFLFFCYLDDSLTKNNIFRFILLATVIAFIFNGFSGRWVTITNETLHISMPILLSFMKSKSFPLKSIKEIKIYPVGAYRLPYFEIYHVDENNQHIKYTFIYTMISKKDLQLIEKKLNNINIKTSILVE